MRKLPLFILGLIAASCGNSGFEMSRYHEDGRAKPVIAVTSMIDTTSYDCPWSISEELTSMIVNQISQGGSIYVNSKDEFAFAENPFSNDLSWMKREFHNQEFAVFLELVEHESLPAGLNKRVAKTVSPHEMSLNLNMGVRLRVVDLRGSTPKIVLQEMVRDSYFIPKTLLPTDYNQVVWGTDEYRKSPMGIAHAQLVQEVVSRVSDYILLAKSR
jgi:hypothetical protein